MQIILNETPNNVRTELKNIDPIPSPTQTQETAPDNVQETVITDELGLFMANKNKVADVQGELNED